MTNHPYNRKSDKYYFLSFTLGVAVLLVGYYTVTSVLGGTTINKTITSNPDLERGLIGHWTFDGPDMVSNVADHSGNGNDGTLTNFTSTTTVPGKIGQALDFAEDNDRVDTGTITHGIGTGDFTYATWAVRTVDTGQSYQGVMANGDFAPAMYVETNNTNIWGGYFGSAMTADTSLTIGEWYHLVMMRSGTTIKFYVNGVQEATTYENATSLANTVFRLGNSSASAVNECDCVLDDSRFYDRALSQEEITRLYDLGATTHINQTITSNPDLEDGLVGHWTFDGPDITADQILDRSGNGNHGGFVGGCDHIGCG